MQILTLKELKSLVRSGQLLDLLLAHVQVKEIAEKKTKNDKPYLEVHVVDSCDNIMLRAWEDAPVYKRCKELLEHGHCVEISGEFAHHATFGLEARTWDFRPLTATEKTAFMGGSKEVARTPGGGFSIHRRNGAGAGRSATAHPVRDVPGRKRRPFPAHGGGAFLPPRAARRSGRTHLADDAFGGGTVGRLQKTQPRPAHRGRALSTIPASSGKTTCRRISSPSSIANAASCSGTSTWASRSSTTCGVSSRPTMRSRRGRGSPRRRRACGCICCTSSPATTGRWRSARRSCRKRRRRARCITSTISTPRWRWCSTAT